MQAEIEYLFVDNLIPYARNARTHTPEQIAQISGSIKEFGFTNPILIDNDNGIIAGHGRVLAAKKLGMEEVPCIRLGYLTEIQKRAYILADNKLALNAGWDDELLKLELEELKAADFDLDLAGFNLEELNDLLEFEEVGLTGDDEVPEPPEELITKPGDIWILGNHRVMCGDSTKKEDVERLMAGEKADCLITDPPYGVNYSAKNEFLNKIDKGNHIQKDIINDIENANNTVEMWRGYFRGVKSILRKGGNYYINFSGDKLILLLLLLREKEIDLPEKQILVWVKNNHVLGRSNYNYKHEFILYGWNGSEGHKHYGGFDTTVWEVNKPLKNDLHPTMKPIELLGRAIKHGSKKEDVIYDGFLGSGSTLIACEKTNRKCYGMEIDPTYCDVIKTRWEEFTGREAVKEGEKNEALPQ